MTVEKPRISTENGWIRQSELPPAFPAYTTALRPVPTNLPNGYAIWDTDLVKPLWIQSGVWVDVTGTAV